MWALLELCSSDEREALLGPLIRGLSAALGTVEDDLQGPHEPELRDRYAELSALAAALSVAPPSRHTVSTEAAWRVALAHLEPADQRLAQKVFERVETSLGPVAMDSDASDAAVFAAAMLEPARRLISELPYTTLAAPGPGRDDYVQRRRTLHCEIARLPEHEGDTPLRAEWRDGYETLVATLEPADDGTSWALEIADPPPGRRAELDLPGGAVGGALLVNAVLSEGVDPRASARARREGWGLLLAAGERDLDRAIDWATGELGDNYVVRSRRGR